MVDITTVSFVVGILGLAVTVVWLLISQFQMRKLLGFLARLVESLRREGRATGDIEKQELEQRQRVQQWREFRDFAKGVGWFLEYLRSEEDEYGEEDY